VSGFRYSTFHDKVSGFHYPVALIKFALPRLPDYRPLRNAADFQYFSKYDQRPEDAGVVTLKNDGGNQEWCEDENGKKWGHRLRDGVNETCTAIVGGKMFIFGGETSGDPGTAVGTVVSFDPNTGHWTHEPSLPVCRLNAVCGSFGDFVIVAGGGDQACSSLPWRDRGPFCDVFKLSISSGEWETVAPMPYPVISAAAGVVDGLLYVVGGMRVPEKEELDEEELDDIELVPCTTVAVYNPSSDTWENLGTPSGGFLGGWVGTLVVVGSRLHGQEGYYNPQQHCWVTNKKTQKTKGQMHFSYDHNHQRHEVSGFPYDGSVPGALNRRLLSCDPTSAAAIVRF
jgi:hypothetical protein